jgi:carbamoyl-phosphate synthase large subunit
MEIIYDQQSLEDYLQENAEMFLSGPILVDSFLTDAIEVDVDAICDGVDVFIAGIMEHIEEAGIHSGDSSCSIPPYSLSQKIIDEITISTKKLAKSLKVIGLMNVQYAVKDEIIYILEVNPRASRTVPFIAKAINIPIAKIAARIMAGESLKSFGLNNLNYTDKTKNHVSVKEPVFPFARFPEVDIILGPEMKSTGEAMAIDNDFVTAFAKAKIASGTIIPTGGEIFISVKNSDKLGAYNLAKELVELGFTIIATSGTCSYLQQRGLNVKMINKVVEGKPHIVDLLKENGIKLVINTTEGKQAIKDSFSIRRTALLNRIPCLTNISSAKALIQSIRRIKDDRDFDVKSLQNYFEVQEELIEV